MLEEGLNTYNQLTPLRVNADGELMISMSGLLNEANIWTEAQTSLGYTLSSASAAVAINLLDDNTFSLIMTENTTLSAPTNPRAYQRGVIWVRQHASAAKSLAINAFWKPNYGATWSGISSTLGAWTRFAYEVSPDATFAIIDKISEVTP